MRLLCVFSFFLLFGCDGTKRQMGVLHVTSYQDGFFELYRVMSDTSFQFISEQIGQFNQDIQLQTGSYLILADCSSQLIDIHPQEQTKLVAHSIEFIPPLHPQSDDLFSIQCSRFEKTSSRQNISNRYQLNILTGERDLLVGMIPLKVNLQSKDFDTPQKIAYRLGGIKISSKNEKYSQESIPYFVSPDGGGLTITQPQKLGKWVFLLPGIYQVMINGTSSQVHLNEMDTHEIKTAYFKMNASTHLDLNFYTQVRGYPFSVFLNEQHTIDINNVYNLLPGNVFVHMEGTHKNESIQLVEDKLTELKMRSVRIDLGCSPWEWECLGKKEITLFEQGQDYPFMEGHSDVPLLYLGENIFVGLEAAKGIRYELPKNEMDTTLYVGSITLTPVPVHKPGQITDLVRLEANGAPLTGYSYDIPPQQQTQFTLIEGQYSLVRYVSQTSFEGDRQMQRDKIVLKKGEHQEIKFNYFVSETKLRQIQKMRVGKTIAQKPKQTSSALN